MAKSNAQRQADYRAKQRQKIDHADYAKLNIDQINALKERLDVVINHGAKLALKRLALHNGLNQADMLIQVLLEVDSKTKKSLHGNELENYLYAVFDDAD